MYYLYSPIMLYATSPSFPQKATVLARVSRPARFTAACSMNVTAASATTFKAAQEMKRKEVINLLIDDERKRNLQEKFECTCI